MDNNDLKVLAFASKATIIIAVEEVVHVRELPWWQRLWRGKRHERFTMCPEFDQHPDVHSIKHLTEEGYLEKGDTEQITHVIKAQKSIK